MTDLKQKENLIQAVIRSFTKKKEEILRDQLSEMLKRGILVVHDLVPHVERVEDKVSMVGGVRLVSKEHEYIMKVEEERDKWKTLAKSGCSGPDGQCQIADERDDWRQRAFDARDTKRAMETKYEEYKATLESLAKLVIPGEIDSADAVVQVMQERDEALALADARGEALKFYASGEHMTHVDYIPEKKELPMYGKRAREALSIPGTKALERLKARERKAGMEDVAGIDPCAWCDHDRPCKEDRAKCLEMAISAAAAKIKGE